MELGQLEQKFIYHKMLTNDVSQNKKLCLYALFIVQSNQVLQHSEMKRLCSFA